MRQVVIALGSGVMGWIAQRLIQPTTLLGLLAMLALASLFAIVIVLASIGWTCLFKHNHDAEEEPAADGAA